MVQILEEENFHHLLTIGEYPLYVLPVDEDVLSFELDLAYKVRDTLLHLIHFQFSFKYFSLLS